MNPMLLAAIALISGAAAIVLWLQQSKLQDQVKEALDRADKAEQEAKKEADRAESAHKKLSQRQAPTIVKEDKGSAEAKAQAVAAKEEVKKLQAALKRHEAELMQAQIAQRRAEAKAEEFAAIAADRTRKPVGAIVPAEVEAPAPRPEPVQNTEETNERFAMRKAELQAERDKMELERERLRVEREAAKATRDADRNRELVEKLVADRGQLRQALIEREFYLRVLERKAEHNRRAYIMTMGALDLAEDELYRIKHGRERPEYQPNRAANISAPEGVEAAAQSAEEAETQVDEAPAAAIPAVALPVATVDAAVEAEAAALLAEPEVDPAPAPEPEPEPEPAPAPAPESEPETDTEPKPEA
jgi:hypothetical protein